jgi:methanogenic corrinoid protein MtbC1
MGASLLLEQALVAMNRAEARRLVLEAKRGGVGQLDAIVTRALERIGTRWDAGDLALSQVYMAGRICEEVLLQPGDPPSTPRLAGPRIALAVLEDYHLLGKRIVLSVLTSVGYPVLDYGRVTAEELVGRVCQDEVAIVMISTLMYPSALRVRDVVDGLAARGSKAKVVVGGAPFRLDAKLGEAVGADRVGRTASDALRIVAELARGA